jgi:multicomponent K+:H+ antiporter subunit E
MGKAMARRSWFPQPLVSVTLGLTWLLLANSLAPADILLASSLAVAIPLLSQYPWSERTAVRKPWVLVKFTSTVLADILVANLVVAKLILLHSPRSYHSRFVELPLQLRSEIAIALLSSAISLTPGTVSVELDPERKHLLIHCLDVDDEAALIVHIKARYEVPLQEIFEAC